MIGIDITDLSDPLLKDREKANRLISNPGDKTQFEHTFWHLWCSKEAVFKAARKKRPFRPASIPIQFTDPKNYISNNLSGMVIENESFVLSVTSFTAEINFQVFQRTSTDPSSEIRDQIRQWFKEKHQTNTSVIKDKNGLPILSHNHSPISITHHGKYLAFTCMVI